MNKQITGLLFEAYRRLDMADHHESQKPLLRRWLGLGTAAAYRPAINAGFMVFHDGQTPPARCMGWLCLTEKGIAELRRLQPEFARVMKDLKVGGEYRALSP